jgi:lysosomal alpha-mannosidase
VKVTWWAFSPSANSSEASLPPIYPAFISGRTVAPASPASPHLTVNVEHPEFWLNPLILVTVRSRTNNTWATTVRPIPDQRSFLVNLFVTTASGWGDTVEIDWVLVRRDTIVESVVPVDQLVNSTAYIGPVVQEIQQSFRAGYAQTVRLYLGTNDELAGNFIEITEEIGPIDAGTEFVTRFTTDLNNQLTCFTDDNSLLIQKRVFNASKHDPVPANYYPMVARAFIQDTAKNVQFTLISDRSHGAASLNAGELEVMLDRRCVSDDGRGVGETLDEKNRTQQVLWAVFDGIDNSALLHRKLAIRQQFPIQTTTYAAAATAGAVRRSPAASGLNSELPYNVHLLALYTQDYYNFTQFSAHPSKFAAASAVDAAQTSRVLVRLQHIFEEGESAKYSTPVSVDLNALLNLQGWRVTNVTEMNLTADRAKADVQKLKWLTSGSLTSPTVDGRQMKSDEASVVTLYPSEIRTFLFEFTASQ